MFNNGTPFSMNVAPTGNGAWGNDSAWIWIILIFAIFFNGGWGNNSGGVQDQYVLASDFATLQRQIDSTSTNTNNLVMTNADQLQRQVTSIANGISSLGYDQLNQMNNINNTINSSTNALSTQLANCCCTNRYEALQNANTTQNLISNGFAQTNYNDATNTCAIKTQIGELGTALATQMATSTRDITDVQNANTQAILSSIQALKDSAKDEKIATLQNQLSDARLIANNSAQTVAIQEAITQAVTKLTPPAPVPAYSVAAPFPYTNGCGCSCGC